MTTDYEKREYLLFQLQNRLQDAIATIDSIESAIVTISLPEEDSFVLQEDKTPATASVILNLETGTELTSEQIKGIETLISRSVPDLANENVVLVDGKGNILNDQPSEKTGGSGYTKLDLESTISRTLESRITKILEPVFGLGSVRVAVNASVEINKSVSEQTTYTPVVEDSGVISKQSTSVSSGSTQTAGGTPGTDTNSEVPTYPQAGDAGGSQSSSESSDTEYLVNQLREQVEHDGYEIKDISAAVLVNCKELSEEQNQMLRGMVASSSGISVEKVTLINAEFALGNSGAAFGNEKEETDHKQTLLYAGIGVGALLILLTGILLVSKKFRKKDEEEEETGVYSPKIRARVEQMPGEIVLNETREQGLKKQIREFTSTSPEVVAQLIRTWMKEGEEDDE
jgi:flagellar M-ring protein FliF